MAAKSPRPRSNSDSSPRTRFKTSVGVDKLLGAQETRDIQAKLTKLQSAAEVDVNRLEAAFVKITKTFSENRGVSYGAWRDAGVPSSVLKKAAVRRTRG